MVIKYIANVQLVLMTKCGRAKKITLFANVNATPNLLSISVSLDCGREARASRVNPSSQR